MRYIKLIDTIRKYLNKKLNLKQYVKSYFSMFSGKSKYVTL